MSELLLQVVIVVAFGALCFGCGYLTGLSFYGAYDPNQSSTEKPICASLDASGPLSMRSGKAGSRALAIASAICSRAWRRASALVA